MSVAQERPQKPSYKRREPETTCLHGIVEHNMKSCLAQAQQKSASGYGYPGFVEREFSKYLDCGQLRCGFVHVQCTNCPQVKRVAFSCKGRGFCPSCTARRMSNTAAHLVDAVRKIFAWQRRRARMESQVRRLGWLYGSFASSRAETAFHRGSLALRDYKDFNHQELLVELGELGADDEVLAAAILRSYKMQHKYKEWVAAHKKNLGDEYQRLTDAGEKAYKGWEASYAKDKKLFDFAFAMEEAVLAGDKRAFANCSAEARELATDYIMRDKPKSVEAFKAVASKPAGGLILAAAYECEKALGNNLMASVFAELLSSAPIARGPRFASQMAIAQVVVELQEERSRFPLEAKDFKPYRPNEAFGEVSLRRFRNASGVVSKVKKDGDNLRISFKKESWVREVFDCKETNRIDRIDATGKIFYREICKKTGTEKVSSQESDILIPKSAGAGIKPGSFVRAARDRKQASQGLPRQVYKSKQRKTMVNYYGLAL